MEKDRDQGESANSESLPRILKEIGSEREVKGIAEKLIPRIRTIREEALKIGEFSAVVQLYQEEFLCAQHMVMEERSLHFRANPIRAIKGLFIMESCAKAMEKFNQEHQEKIDRVVSARVFRFLGRYADYRHQYGKSEAYYRQGLDQFEQMFGVEQRFNRLELLGFLSFSLLKQGKTETGLKLAQQVLREYDESEEGKWLKAHDYYTWAVWKSGVEIRTAEYIIKNQLPGQNNLVDSFMKDADNILVMPDGNKDIFRLRRDELWGVRNL